MSCKCLPELWAQATRGYTYFGIQSQAMGYNMARWSAAIPHVLGRNS